MKIKQKSAISLIVLVITIIVMIILATTIILSLQSSGIIGRANEATFKNDMVSLKQELNAYIIDKKVKENDLYDEKLLNADESSLEEMGEIIVGKNITNILTSLKEKYLGKIIIKGGELVFVGNEYQELAWAKEALEDIKGIKVVEATNKESSIILNNSRGLELINYSIYGNSVQNGTPSVDVPVEVESVGDKTLNLFDVKKWFTDYLNDENGITFNNTQFSTIRKIKIMEGEFKENTQYTIQFDYEIANSDNNGITVEMYDSNGERIAYNWTSKSDCNGSYTLTNPVDTTISYMLIGYSTAYRTCDVKLINMQVTEGNFSVDYEPYGKYKIPIMINGKNLLPELKYVNFYSNSETENIETAVFLKAGKYTLSIDKLINCTSWRLYFKLWDKNGNRILNTTGNTLAGLSEYGKFSYVNSNGEKKGFYWNYNDNYNRQAILMQNNMQITENPEILLEFNNDYYVRFYVYNGDTSSNTSLINVQLEKGHERTEFEPYEKSKIINIYLDEPLRKIGDNVDYIDFRKGKVFRNVEVIDSTGTLPLEQSLKGVIDKIGTNIELPEISLLKGTNTLLVETEIKPSEISVKYYSNE